MVTNKFTITLDLDQDFVNMIERLNSRYGEEFSKLNGFHNDNLNFTSFIDHFVDSNTLADATIDGNANSSVMDVTSLMQDMMKPHTKLLSFNKIFVEMKKKYGLEHAEVWLMSEWVGDSYLHNAHSASFKPYCFSGDTKILTKNGIKPLVELVGSKIQVLNKNRGWENAEVKYFGKQPVKRLVLSRYGVDKEITVTGNHKWFVRDGKELVEVETNSLEVGMKIPFNTSGTWYKVNPSPFGVAHGFFTGDGDKSFRMRANFCGDKTALLPYFTPAKVRGDEHEYTTLGAPKYFAELPSLDESASYLYGWLSGYFSADGCVDEKGRCTIASTQRENLERVRDVLCVLGMPVNEIRFQDRITDFSNGENSRIYVMSLSNEYLKDDFFIRQIHKERFEKSNSVENRKNRSWIVKSVEDLGVEMDVYCAVTESTQSFTLDHNVLTHNCFAYDLDGLAEQGLFFIDGYKTKPAGHLDTFNKHILQFVSWTSNLSTGACGIPSYLLYSYYFWKKDVESGYCADAERYRDQEFQSFIYNMNQPFLRVTQSAFTNLSIFDRNYYIELFGGRTFPDGSPMYPCCDEFMEYQKAFMRMVAKVRKDQMFTFPVLSYSLLFKDGEFVDKEFARWCSDTNCDWNDSNFYIGNDVTVLSNCCRLLSDMSELDGFMNSIGGTSLKIGSAVVNTINLRRIGLHVGFDEDRYITALREQAQLSIEVMDVIRGILSRNVEKGLLPNYSNGLVEMDKQFNTIGVTAMYETMRDFGYIETDEVGDEFYSDKGLAFATRIFDELNNLRKNSGLGYSLNIECVPAERANVILAQKDNLMHPEHDVGDFVYSNQWIPLMHRCSIEEKIHLGSVLDKMCGGGRLYLATY